MYMQTLKGGCKMTANCRSRRQGLVSLFDSAAVFSLPIFRKLSHIDQTSWCFSFISVAEKIYDHMKKSVLISLHSAFFYF